MVESMNIHKRFIVQFFIQFILIFVLLFIMLLITSAIIGFSTTNDEVKEDLSTADSFFFYNRITFQGEKAIFDDDLKRLAKNQNGMLLVLTTKGDVIGSYNSPKHVPSHFKESELATFILNTSTDSVEYTHWKLDDETYSRPLVLLFGKTSPATNLLNKVKPDVNWKDQHLHLSATTLQQIDEQEAWIQLLNSNGKVVDAYGKDKEAITYSVQAIHTLSETAADSVAAYFDAETEQTIIVGIDEPNSTLNLEIGLFHTINNSFIVMFVLLILLLLFCTFWYARKFGIPLITMMKWIQNLGSGFYEQPLDIHQHPVMLNKKGKLKRSYRLYKEMISTLSHLTETLQLHETQRKKMAQTREEWISGLSHDLKTPLSSISGYAQMLKSENYSWTEAETREFSGIIDEKSIYMMELLEDLTLTFRLKNQGLPIAKEMVDINEYIRRIIIHYVNDPANSDKELVFLPHNETTLAAIDTRWFQRIIDNLIANAIKYNPNGTTITISISPIERHLIIITIEDNGIGMDKETLGKLFHRYYRGTNTSDSGSGTGLGMAITKQLVQLHNGSINVKSTLNKGTTVRIILPTDIGEELDYTL